MTTRLVSDLLFFARSVTVVLGALAIGYGTLTFTFGAALWSGPSHVYGTALTVPYAPQSWGVVAIVAGVLVVTGQLASRHRVVVAGAAVMILWFLFFAISFLFDVVNSGNPFGAPGVLVYTLLCVLMVLRVTVRIPAVSR
ncbi:hypothetical protein CH273_25810 [Rhodococcus sp. 05-339-2]|uniref:hypothetical protein n=1 Tax=Rhodococcoides fascians TaxID=1828 RepID=UPI00068B060F|nr:MULTISPECIES: hypothetical protein [Rhodococcus]OZD74904.1 hypothetical protein CH273_25810 [Rhodococcus sp. 05-339-2]